MQRRFVAMETKIMWKNCQFWQKCVCWRWFNILGWFLRESKFFTFHVNLNAYWQPLLSISWYQEIDFLISRIHFLISRNIILDIKKWNLFLAGIGITFFSMCQMAPSILFQWDISNFNGPFDNLNVPKGRKLDMAFKCIFVWCGFNNGVLLHVSAYCLVHVHAK